MEIKGNLSDKMLIRRMSNSNSSSYLIGKKINLGNEDVKTRNNFNNYFESFHSDEENINYTQRGLNSEIYERLKNENLDFIKTLLRLKQKMNNSNNIINNENKVYYSYEKKKINNNERIENLKKKKSNNFLYDSPVEISRNKKVKFINSFKKVNFTENKRKKNSSSKLIPNNDSSEKKIRQISAPKKINKQKTISFIPNSIEIKKMKKINKQKNKKTQKNKKSFSSHNLIRIDNTSNNCNNNNVPIAIITLFDEYVDKENNEKKLTQNKFHFTPKKYKKNG